MLSKHVKQAELTFGQLCTAALVYTTSVDPYVVVSFCFRELTAARDFLSACLLHPISPLADNIGKEDFAIFPGVRKNCIAWSFWTGRVVALRKELELLSSSV